MSGEPLGHQVPFFGPAQGLLSRRDLAGLPASRENHYPTQVLCETVAWTRIYMSLLLASRLAWHTLEHAQAPGYTSTSLASSCFANRCAVRSSHYTPAVNPPNNFRARAAPPPTRQHFSKASRLKSGLTTLADVIRISSRTSTLTSGKSNSGSRLSRFTTLLNYCAPH
jgi:hypothetical protein